MTMTLFDVTTTRPAILEATPPCMHGAVLRFGWAGFSNGHRAVTASLVDKPGRVGSCSYTSLWVDASEHEFGRGEPWIYAQRYPGGEWRRESLTDKAIAALRHDLAPAFAGDGFERAWRAAFHLGVDGEAEAMARTARLVAGWWERQGLVSRIVAECGSDVRYELLPRELGKRDFAVRRPNRHGNDWSWAHPIARIMLGSDHVGYLDGQGNLLPVQDLDLR